MAKLDPKGGGTAVAEDAPGADDYSDLLRASPQQQQRRVGPDPLAGTKDDELVDVKVVLKDLPGIPTVSLWVLKIASQRNCPAPLWAKLGSPTSWVGLTDAEQKLLLADGVMRTHVQMYEHNDEAVTKWPEWSEQVPPGEVLARVARKDFPSADIGKRDRVLIAYGVMKDPLKHKDPMAGKTW
jgi:hypothetical protein